MSETEIQAGLKLPAAGAIIEVLRRRLRRFPDPLINDWLKELEDMHLRVARGGRPRCDHLHRRGAAAIITKPYSRNQLVEVITHVLKN